MNVRLEGGAKMEARPRYISIKLSGKVNGKAVEGVEMGKRHRRVLFCIGMVITFRLNCEFFYYFGFTHPQPTRQAQPPTTPPLVWK